MFIPLKRKNKLRMTIKTCLYNGCDREFISQSSVRKYCDIHRRCENRKRIHSKGEHPSIRNKIFKHTFTEPTLVEFSCKLDGCSKKYEIIVYPRQYIYPKFCECHRNEYKRLFYNRISQKTINAIAA